MELNLTNSTNSTNFSITENNDKAYVSSLNLCLDAFIRIVRGAEISDYIAAFSAAWKENKEIMVKILMNLRDIRKGKGEKLIPIVTLVHWKECLPENIYVAILKKVVIDNGCWKDILRILEISTRFKLNSSSKYLTKSILFNIKNSIEINLFAEQLKKDLKIFTQSESSDKSVAISLCAKWAPTEETHFDHHPINAAKHIAKVMGINMKEYRQMLTKLRKHLNILERLMSTGQYDLIDFSKIPSVAMMKFKNAFKRDSNANGKESDLRKQLHLSYDEYIKKLSEGKAKINITGIQPHELVRTYLHDPNKDIDQQIEAQWKTLVERVMKSGTFENTVAISDVSSSMTGEPMDVSVALGILVSQCTIGPFHGKIMTFSDNPTWHNLGLPTLRENVYSLSKAKWGCSTNMRAAFDLILNEAIENKLLPEQMVKTIFIFTDMQFNAGVTGNIPWESTFEYVKRTYTNVGYTLPNIICWNLRTSKSKTMPIMKDELGFAMLSGFSAELLKCVLYAEEFTPISIMNHTLEPYEVPIEIINCGIDDLQYPNTNIYILEEAVKKSEIKKSFKNNNKTDESKLKRFESDISLINKYDIIASRYSNSSSSSGSISDYTSDSN